MDQGPEHANSYYAATSAARTVWPTLIGDLDADVCVVGGGLTGLNAGLRCAELGMRVVLLEARRIGWGASGRNGGQLIVGQRQDQMTLERECGEDPARALWDLGLEAVARVRDLASRFHIDCDLRPGHLTAAWKPAHADELHRYAEHLATRYAYTQTRFVPAREMQAYVASPRYHGGLYDGRSAHLHTLNFVLGLASAAASAGVQIYEDSAALELIKGGATAVRTQNGQVRAKFIVLACNGYLGALEPTIAPYILPLNNYIVATEPLSEPHAIIPCGAAVSDTKFVLDYYRLSPEGRLIFGGGETYGTHEPADVKEFVRPYLERTFPQLRGVRLDYGWGGTLAITMPRLPHVGRIDRTIYFAHGYSGHGLGIATQMGALIAEAINGQAAKFDVYGQLKIPKLPGGAMLRRPLLTAAMMWFALRDRL